LLSLCLDGPPAINGKSAGYPIPFRFAFLPLALFKHALELLCLPLQPQYTNTRARAQFPRRRRLCFIPPPDADGGVHRRLIPFFPGRDCLPHVALVVQGKPPTESCSVRSLGPRLPERRPSRRRRRTPSLLPPLRP
jgi:hypothetical protein